MLFVVEERLKGFKYNIGLGGGGGSTKGGDRYVHYAKKGPFLTLLSLVAVYAYSEAEKFLYVLRMTKSFISLTVNCRVDINHPLLTGWREGRSPSAKANYARKFSKSKSSKGE